MKEIEGNYNDETGILSREDARFLAARIFKRIDKENKGFITLDEIASWRKNSLEQMNLNDIFSVDSQQIFFTSLDYNRDERVTLDDFENLLFRYLCNIKI